MKKQSIHAKKNMASFLSRSTFLFLLISSFPVGVLASWSSPGENFRGELIFGGPVTNSKNPWSWKLMSVNDALSLSADDRMVRSDEHVWSGLLKGGPILLGKTTHTIPTGREGFAPRVNYGSNVSGVVLTWLSDGEGIVSLPVYDEGDPVPVGQLHFRLQVAMLLQHTENEQPIYARVYNNLAGNGLPLQGKISGSEMIAPWLCGLFAGEGPGWLCAVGSSVKKEVALGGLTDSALRLPHGVYGAGIVAGSGELTLRKDAMPARWKSSLSVSIEYQ